MGDDAREPEQASKGGGIMHRYALTPHRRAALYERVLGEEDVDSAHLVVHALASTPDGPLEVRENYTGLGIQDWTPAELLDDYVEVTGVPEADPSGEPALTRRERAAARLTETDIDGILSDCD